MIVGDASVRAGAESSGAFARALAVLGELEGQWIEANGVTPTGALDEFVTSRGWAVRGVVAKVVETGCGVDDPTVVGRFIDGLEIERDGTLMLATSFEEGRDPVRFAARAPWRVVGPRGARASCDAAGALASHPAGARVFATDEALDAWRSAELTAVDRALLDLANDDWLSPADVVGEILQEAGAASASDARTRDEIAAAGIDSLARLLVQGRLEAGYLIAHRYGREARPNGFHPSNESIGDIVEHVATTWHALAPRLPGPGQIAWFASVPDAGSSRTT